MTDIIANLKELDVDINLYYRNSKLPKWLKKIIVKNKRRRLHELIESIDNTDQIPVELLDEYRLVLYDTYPPNGRYRNCYSVTNDSETNMITFIIKIDEDKSVAIMIDMSHHIIDKGERYIITRYTYVANGQTKFAYSEDVKYNGFIGKDSSVGNDMLSSNINNQKQIAKNICIEAIHDDIVYFLKEIVERSERIYQI